MNPVARALRFGRFKHFGQIVGAGHGVIPLVTKTRSRRLLTCRYPVDDTFADHDHRCMGAACPGNARHHRRVSHPQVLDARRPPLDRRPVPSYRFLIRAWPSLRFGGSRDPKHRCWRECHPQGGSADRPPLGMRWTPTVSLPFARLRAPGECHFDAGDNSNERTAGHWDRPRPTVHILSRPATPACTRSVPPALGNITSEVSRPYTGDVLLPFVDDWGGSQHHFVHGARAWGSVVQ
jgi:hypothetical protein